jgi:hypothetical protein
MRRVIQHACVATLLAGTIELRAWMVGNGLLNVQAETAFNYSSNLQARSDGAAASYLDLHPSLAYERSGAAVKTTGSAGVTFERRLSGWVPDQTLYQGSLNLTADHTLWPSSSLRAHATYAEGYVDDLNVNARVLNRNTDLGANGDWSLGSRSKASFTTGYRLTDSERYTQQEVWNAGTTLSIMLPQDRSIFTEFNHQETSSSARFPGGARLAQQVWNYAFGVAQTFSSGTKVSVAAGYMDLHRSAEETRNGFPGQSGPTVKATVEGPFLPPSRFPKMSSRISLNYGYGQTPGLNDRGGSQFTGEAAVGWNARPFTRLELLAVRTRSLTVDALTAESTLLSASVTQTVGGSLTLATYAGYQWLTLRGTNRETEAVTAGLNADQKLGSRGRWFARLSYSFRDATSTEKASVFSQHTFRFSVTYRY